MPHMKRVTPAELENAGTIPELVARLKTGTQEVKQHVARLLEQSKEMLISHVQQPTKVGLLPSSGDVSPLAEVTIDL